MNNEDEQGRKVPGRRFLIAGGIIMILQGLAHTMAHILQEPPPANEEEAQLRHLMDTHVFELLRVKFTMSSILNGFSFCFVVFSVLAGVLAIGAAIRQANDRCAVRGVSWWCVVASGAILGLSVLYFPPPPMMFSGPALALFLVAALRATAARGCGDECVTG
ncbi:MAG TPA: hypothetical protein VG797_07545 [Phycisphaerales bacterium]|nr:hypothetical protein [Phycisphaerales bacterium]